MEIFIQFLGRRREIEFKRAGYNIELPAPLDNIPFSTLSERERIEVPVRNYALPIFYIVYHFHVCYLKLNLRLNTHTHSKGGLLEYHAGISPALILPIIVPTIICLRIWISNPSHDGFSFLILSIGMKNK